MSATNRLTRHTPHAYLHPDNLALVALWHVRIDYLDAAERIAEGKRGKGFYYRWNNPATGISSGNTDWRVADNGRPAAELADRCLYELAELREVVGGGGGQGQPAAHKPLPLIWCEGEKDCVAAWCMGAEATTHHGGAGKATPEQAHEFAPLSVRRLWSVGPLRAPETLSGAGDRPSGPGAGSSPLRTARKGVRADRRRGGRVLVAADRDDAGAACALRRFGLLLAAGLHGDQVTLVRAAVDRVGADLDEHERAGLGLRDLVPLTGAAAAAGAERRLKLAAERWAAKVAGGMTYGDWESAETVAQWNARMNGDSRDRGPSGIRLIAANN